MKKHIVTTALCLFALAACDKPAETKAEDPAGKNATTTNATATGTAATPTAAQPTPVTINDTDVATPADFEETAEKAITAKNYKAELTVMENDLAKAD